jgi:hypothetical protein
MSLNQIIAVIVVATDAVFAFLAAQPDGTFSPTVKLVFGAASVALTTVALYLRPSLPGQPQP